MTLAIKSTTALTLLGAVLSSACTSEVDKGTGQTTAASCGLHTTYAGDENCILPPAPEDGLQLHVGPSSYDDPEVINATDVNGKYLWLMEPGDERTQCYHLYTSNDADHYYFRQKYRMRFGSHHMIIMGSSDATTPEGWDAASSQFCGTILNSIGGTQTIVSDFPPGGEVGPEDKGLGRKLTAHNPLDLQLHFYNATSSPTLREVWVNLMYIPDSEYTTNLGMLGGFTRMNVPPHTLGAQITGQCLAEQAIGAGSPVRIVSLFGHAHTHNRRYAVNRVKADGVTSELVYDSYDGAESPTFVFNSVVNNPVPDPATRKTGAASGQLLLAPGEKLVFTCDIDNTTDNTFVGLNEVQTDEMCHLFGSVAGAGFPCFKLQ